MMSNFQQNTPARILQECRIFRCTGEDMEEEKLTKVPTEPHCIIDDELWAEHGRTCDQCKEHTLGRNSTAVVRVLTGGLDVHKEERRNLCAECIATEHARVWNQLLVANAHHQDYLRTAEDYRKLGRLWRELYIEEQSSGLLEKFTSPIDIAIYFLRRERRYNNGHLGWILRTFYGDAT